MSFYNFINNVNNTYPQDLILPDSDKKQNKLLLIHGECSQVLKMLPPETIDLIVTSPPYADQRKNIYGGVCADHYVNWFIPIADELFNVLKPTGSFILNIKERVVNGERHTYVMELIIEMRKRGWLFTEEYIWHKKKLLPGKMAKQIS